MARARGDEAAAAAALDVLGITAESQGSWDEACAFLEEGLAIYRRLNDRRMIGALLCNLTLAMIWKGDYSHEEPYLLESLALMKEVGDVFNTANVLLSLADAAVRRGNAVEARSYAQECIGLATEIGSKTQLSWAKSFLAGAAWIDGDRASCAALLGEAIRGLHEAGYWQETAGALIQAAALTAAEPPWERTARILGIVGRVYSAHAATPRTDEGARLDETMAACQQAMGTDAFAASRMVGQSMPVDEGIAYALESLAMARPNVEI